MKLRIALNRDLSLGLRDQIVSEIARLVHDRVLLPGTRLPSCRKLANELDVSVNTTVSALGDLQAQNLIYSKPRSGYFVSEERNTRRPDMPERQPTEKNSPLRDRLNWNRHSENFSVIRRPTNWYDYKYPFVCNQIDEDSFPIAQWRECSRQAMNRRDLKIWSSDGHFTETAELVEQICTRILPRRGVYSTTSETMITLGSQNGLFISSQLLGGRDRVAVIEEPSYPDARKILRSSFGELRFQPVDEEGLIIDERLKGATLVFVTPNRQYPTTFTMSEQRRRDLVSAAEEYDFFIIEDDYECDVDYRHFTPLPLFSLDSRGRVIYLASLSKGLSPGLRLGYMSASLEFINVARDMRGTILRHPPTLLQLTAATFIRFGYYESLLRRVHHDGEIRWKIADRMLKDLLPGFEILGEFGGTNFLLSDQSKTWTAEEIVQKARRENVIVEDVSPCFSDPEIGKYFFRLGVSSIQTNLIEPGIEALVKSMKYRLSKIN